MGIVRPKVFSINAITPSTSTWAFLASVNTFWKFLDLLHGYEGLSLVEHSADSTGSPHHSDVGWWCQYWNIEIDKVLHILSQGTVSCTWNSVSLQGAGQSQDCDEGECEFHLRTKRMK